MGWIWIDEPHDGADELMCSECGKVLGKKQIDNICCKKCSREMFKVI